MLLPDDNFVYFVFVFKLWGDFFMEQLEHFYRRRRKPSIGRKEVEDSFVMDCGGSLVAGLQAFLFRRLLLSLRYLFLYSVGVLFLWHHERGTVV